MICKETLPLESSARKQERILRHMENPWVRLAFLVGMSVLVFGKWLTQKPKGLLVLAITAYFAAPVILASRPLSFGELILWVDEQSPETKVAMSTVLVTVVGFLLAFSVAHSAWRAQQRTQIRLAAEDEIYAFFSEFCDLLLSLELYAEFLVEAHAEIKSDVVPDEGAVEFLANQVEEKTSKFWPDRARLSRMSIEVHALQSKHELVLAQQRFAMPAFEKIKAAVELVTQEMWFYAPLGMMDPIRRLALVSLRDPKEWAEFAQVCEERRTTIGVANGAIRGLILGELIHPTGSSVLRFFGTSKAVVAIGIEKNARTTN